MGRYVFSTKLLFDIFDKDHQVEKSSYDFGKDILPGLIRRHQVCPHYFDAAEGRVSQDPSRQCRLKPGHSGNHDYPRGKYLASLLYLYQINRYVSTDT